MKKIALTITTALLLGGLAACTDSPSSKAPETAKSAASDSAQSFDNVLLAPYSGPYGGVPAFDKMSLEDLKPALEKGMELNMAEIEAIANNPEAPTFANTIVPLEKAGEALNRVFTYWGIWSSNKNSPEFRAIQGEMVPVISAFSSKITLN